MTDFFTGVNPLVLCIPFISGFIGWFTNWIAVKAMLYPVEFFGVPPLLGWQGVIPKNTEELSRSFSELISEKLIDVEEIFGGISIEDNAEIKRVVDEVAQEIIFEFSTNLAPDNWARAREKLRGYIRDLVRRNVRSVTEEILERMSREASDFIDVEAIVRDTMVEDRPLLGSVLSELAEPEFKFIERSGLYFGGLFGVFQMFVWIAYPSGWVLPAAGFIVGYATNWLAMTLIFEPHDPMQIGPFQVQGVFIKRQLEVARKFADVIVERVLCGDNLIQHLGQGSSRGAITQIVEDQVETSMQLYERDAMVAMLISKDKIAEAREDLLDRVRKADISKSGTIRAFANQSDRIHAQIEENLRKLRSDEFGDVLRRVFQKDEWKLVLAGGVIGTMIGVLQVVFLFGGF